MDRQGILTTASGVMCCAQPNLSLKMQAKEVDLRVSRETAGCRPLKEDLWIKTFWRTTPSSTKEQFSLKRRHRSGT